MSELGKRMQDLSAAKPVGPDDLFVISQTVTGQTGQYESRRLAYSGLSSTVYQSLQAAGIATSYVPLSDITQELGDSTTKVVSQKLLSTSLGNVKVDLTPLYEILVGQRNYLNSIV